MLQSAFPLTSLLVTLYVAGLALASVAGLFSARRNAPQSS